MLCSFHATYVTKLLHMTLNCGCVITQFEHVLLQRRCRCPLSTAHLSVILTNPWCSQPRPHIEYLLAMSLLIDVVRVLLEALRHDGRLQQAAMFP